MIRFRLQAVPALVLPLLTLGCHPDSRESPPPSPEPTGLPETPTAAPEWIGGLTRTFSGDGTDTEPLDGTLAADTSWAGGCGMVAHSDGTVYVADCVHQKVRLILPDGSLKTLAGTGVQGLEGDNGPALQAQLSGPEGLALDEDAQRLYIAESGANRVRMIALQTGIITTFAGQSSGLAGASGDGRPASEAWLAHPAAVAVAPNNVLIADTGNSVVRRVNASGIISTFAGRFVLPDGEDVGDGGPATSAYLSTPNGLQVSLTGGQSYELYIGDSGGSRVRKVDAQGVISTVVGTGHSGPKWREGATASTSAIFPTALALDAGGSLYVGDLVAGLVAVVHADGRIWTFAGTGKAEYNGEGLPALETNMEPWNMVLVPGRSLLVGCNGFLRILEVSLEVQTASTRGQ